MNVTDPLRDHARTKPNAPAIVRVAVRIPRAMRTTTYGELDRIVDGIARRALDLGLAPGDVAGLAIEKSAEIGRTYAVLAMSLGLARAGIAAKIMSESGASVALCFVTDAAASPPGVRTALVDDTWFHAPPEGSVAPVASHQDGKAICRIFPTSGTTGQQKEVAVSHAIMAARIRIKNEAQPMPAHPIYVAQLGADSGYGFRDILRVLTAGGTVALARTPEQLVITLEQLRANMFAMAPGTLAALLQALPEGHGPFPWIDWFEVGGAPFPARLYDAARARLTPDIRSTYGSAETGTVAEGPMSALIDRPGAVGYVTKNVELEVVDEHGAPVPPGTEGIVRVRGDCCVDHYLNDPEATALAFRNGWFYPGDLGSVGADGLLTIAGRAIELINHGGTKISPRVIEDALLAVPGVTDAAAFGVPDEFGITTICAAIAAEDGFDRGALRAVSAGLGIAAPRRVLRVRTIPRNANGKISRGELARLVASQQTAGFDA